MADVSRATVCKALIATVQLSEKCACIPFLVLSTVMDDVILGIDFLCAIRASLHCGPTQLHLTPMCLQTPTGRRNTIRATTASQDPLPGWETTLGGTIEAYITHTQTATDAIPKTTARTPRKKAKEGQERCQLCSRGPLVDGEPSLRPFPSGEPQPDQATCPHQQSITKTTPSGEPQPDQATCPHQQSITKTTPSGEPQPDQATCPHQQSITKTTPSGEPQPDQATCPRQQSISKTTPSGEPQPDQATCPHQQSIAKTTPSGDPPQGNAALARRAESYHTQTQRKAIPREFRKT
ncbi:hypothetical protein ACLKA7_001970 [Drosophila subpalustris]